MSTTAQEPNWFNSDWGPGPLLRLAIPLMISAGFVSLTLFTDRLLLYWLSDSAASAATGAGTLYWATICFPVGLLSYLSTFVSQYRGASHPERIGAAYRNAMFLAYLFIPTALVLAVIGVWIFARSGHNSELVAMEAGYYRILLIGGCGTCFYTVQSGLLTGAGRTGTVMWIDFVGTLLNLILDAVLIFGFGPIPAMGIMGAAIATAVSFWIKIPIAGWLIHRSPYFVEQCGIYRATKLDWGILRRMMHYGAPAGLQAAGESICFLYVMLQVGSLGELAMAATTLALGLNVLGFIPMMGLGIGVGVLVGQHLTEGRKDLARRSVTIGLAVSTIYTAIFALILTVAPQQLISVYAFGATEDRFLEISPLLIPLLRVIACYCILDGLQVVFAASIKGAGDTKFVLLGTCLNSLIVVVCGEGLERLVGPSLMMWWYIIAGWVVLMALTFGGRYYSGAWESKRVIEHFGNPPEAVPALNSEL